MKRQSDKGSRDGGGGGGYLSPLSSMAEDNNRPFSLHQPEIPSPTAKEALAVAEDGIESVLG